MDTQLIHSMDQTNRRHKTDVKKKKIQSSICLQVILTLGCLRVLVPDRSLCGSHIVLLSVSLLPK